MMTIFIASAASRLFAGPFNFHFTPGRLFCLFLRRRRRVIRSERFPRQVCEWKKCQARKKVQKSFFLPFLSFLEIQWTYCYLCHKKFASCFSNFSLFSPPASRVNHSTDELFGSWHIVLNDVGKVHFGSWPVRLESLDTDYQVINAIVVTTRVFLFCNQNTCIVQSFIPLGSIECFAPKSLIANKQ